jgi:hypothetical protein
MAIVRIVFYPHRRNKDGSYDSICLNCFATVACTETEGELAEHEKNHNCNASSLANTRHFSSLSRVKVQ